MTTDHARGVPGPGTYEESPAGWRTYGQEELDRQYSPSSRVDDLGVHLARYATDSALARSAPAARTALRCGPLPEQTFDLFPAARAGAPLLVFVHGGYWQEQSRNEAAFAARDFVAAGISFAALGYGLAPRHSMRQVTAAAGDSLRWICTSLAQLPGAPRTVHLAGHSAGAHLVVSALLDPEGWRRAGTTASDAVSSAVLLSGVYDLEPLRHTYVNDLLGMDEDEARDCSPQLRLPAALPPLIVARGENETDEFARQQERFVRSARLGGTRVTPLVVDGRHHFDLPFDLGDPATSLGNEVLRRVVAR
ncbi:alpha/beta hydrolase [Streptomyces sp. NPDC091272]|uniref:alpha/beta hydrolase n=1 Tax=Streptomyces sp. NPDC091272 TaxID=3365981 RepID=UPI003808A5B6